MSASRDVKHLISQRTAFEQKRNKFNLDFILFLIYVNRCGHWFKGTPEIYLFFFFFWTVFTFVSVILLFFF